MPKPLSIIIIIIAGFHRLQCRCSQGGHRVWIGSLDAPCRLPPPRPERVVWAQPSVLGLFLFLLVEDVRDALLRVGGCPRVRVDEIDEGVLRGADNLRGDRGVRRRTSESESHHTTGLVEVGEAEGLVGTTWLRSCCCHARSPLRGRR